MTNKISNITKRDIFDIFKDGIDVPDLWDTKRVTYYYYGRLEEIDFLKRLYSLENIESLDSRYPNAVAAHSKQCRLSPCWYLKIIASH